MTENSEQLDPIQSLSSQLRIDEGKAETIINMGKTLTDPEESDYTQVELTDDESGILPRISKGYRSDKKGNPVESLVVTSGQSGYAPEKNERLKKIAAIVSQATGLHVEVYSQAREE